MSDRGPLGARLRQLDPRSPDRDGPALVTLLVVVGVLVLNLVQQPGRITFDTKLDLQFAPLDFLTRSLTLWNPDAAFGGLQNQASGYLFPMGPAFVLGELLGVPSWVWERLWSAAVMLLAYEGARRLARAWPGVGRWGAVLAGLSYMAAPRVLTTVGPLSGETLPTAVLPWTVLPLALYLCGRWRRWPALVLSAVSVLFMGGQNATLVVACLVLPGLLLLTAAGRPVRRVLVDVAGWSALVVVATFWWLVPLVLLGSYAPPFLDFIESSTNTAGGTGWLTSLRGTNHWVAYFPGGGPSGWLGGWELATSGLLLVTTVLVAVLGLAGLARGRLAFRLPLVLSLLVGLACLTLGSGGWAGSPLAVPWLDALDSWLAPFRNVHKFDPLVRLPLSLGVGAFVTGIVPVLATRIPAGRRRGGTAAMVGVTALLVLAAAQPAFAGHLRSADGMTDLPDEWRETAAFLEAVPGPAAVLVLPGSGFAVQEWGRTIDEPIQVLGGPPWAARAQVTVAPAGTLRILDALERRVAEGRPIPGLAELLRRLGITHVVVRGDLDPADSDAPDPELVRASVSGDTGLTPLAGFGDGAGPSPLLAVYGVDGTEDRRASLLDWEERVLVDGGPEAVVDLVGAGLLDPDRPMLVAEDGEAAAVVTDGNRRVERSFGRVHGAVSGVMSAIDEFRLDRRVHDFLGEEVPEQQTVAEYDGLEQVVASSSAGYADTFGQVSPEEHPYAAIDPSPFTSWGSDAFLPPEGQWLELRFREPVEPGEVSLLFDVANGAEVASVELVTDAGSRVVPVGSDGRLDSTAPTEGATDRLRVVVRETVGSRRQVRLSDLRVEGQELRRSLRLPGVLDDESTLHLRSETPQRACARAPEQVSCEERRQVETTEAAGFARTFEVAQSGSWELDGWAVATNGPTVTALFDPLGPEQVAVTASSTFGGDAAVTAANVHDGDEETSWYAAPTDGKPVLELRWKKPRTIRSVLATLSDGAPGRLPDTFFVDPLRKGEEPQLVDVTGPDAGELESVRTNRLRVTALLEDSDDDSDEDTDDDTGDDTGDDSEGIGISELDVDGIEDLRHRPELESETGVLCGFGPTVSVAGRTIRLGVRGTLADVVGGARLPLTRCGAEPVQLPEGEHLLEVTNGAGFSVSELVLRPADTGDPTPSADAGAAGDVTVRDWGPVRRTVEVGAADEAVLTVPESHNVGWEATLDGQRLEPVRVDGWKQGWLLPEGAAGTVTMTYAPQRTFSVGLGAGAVLAGALALAGVLLWRRRAAPRTTGQRGATPDGGQAAPTYRWSGPASRLRRPALVVALLLLALVSPFLAVGAAVGGASGHLPAQAQRQLLSAALGLLPLAAVLALASSDSILSPPQPSDALAALAVGLAVGLALRPDHDSGLEPAEGFR